MPIALCCAALSEKERELISTQTKAALAILKTKGAQLGNQTNLDDARLLAYNTNRKNASAFAENVLPMVKQLNSSGIAVKH